MRRGNRLGCCHQQHYSHARFNCRRLGSRCCRPCNNPILEIPRRLKDLRHRHQRQKILNRQKIRCNFMLQTNLIKTRQDMVTLTIKMGYKLHLRLHRKRQHHEISIIINSSWFWIIMYCWCCLSWEINSYEVISTCYWQEMGGHGVWWMEIDLGCAEIG